MAALVTLIIAVAVFPLAFVARAHFSPLQHGRLGLYPWLSGDVSIDSRRLLSFSMKYGIHTLNHSLGWTWTSVETSPANPLFLTPIGLIVKSLKTYIG
jgi:hypothetical protein